MIDKNYSNEVLLSTIIEGIMKKKGREIVSLDFKGIENSFCDYFIICDADSNTHVDAIADSVEFVVKNNLGIRAGQKEGLENSQWVLLNFAGIIVHIFQRQFRDYYKLEDLWSDARLSKFEDPLKN